MGRNVTERGEMGLNGAELHRTGRNRGQNGAERDGTGWNGTWRNGRNMAECGGKAECGGMRPNLIPGFKVKISK